MMIGEFICWMNLIIEKLCVKIVAFNSKFIITTIKSISDIIISNAINIIKWILQDHITKRKAIWWS